MDAPPPILPPDPPLVVVLAVAVHRDAGTIADIAVDGAAGLCRASGPSISCPARGPVSFRYGANDAFVLVGETVLDPGERGTAVVWAIEAQVADVRARLAAGVTPDIVRDVFIRTGDHPVPVPSAGLFEDLLGLVDHADPLVRRELVEALVPYFRCTENDPFPRGSPPVVPFELLERLAVDPDTGTRRRLAARLRDLRAPGQPHAETATTLLLELAGEGGSVQRAAFASLASRARDGRVPALDTWDKALARVTVPGPPGRAAANTLAALATSLEAGEAPLPASVDPGLAVALTAQHQIERTWTVWRAWRAHVPFDAALAERLLRETVGLSASLIRSWADEDPDALAAVLARWEPAAPHSQRFVAIRRALAAYPHEGLRRALANDNLSAGTEERASQ